MYDDDDDDDDYDYHLTTAEREALERARISRSFDRLESGFETAMHVGTLGASFIGKKLFGF